ncbi:hypothetical protein Tco_0678479 [Tanacetum coccineum]|uniref:Uncharacterized protein n=1 Tax=Tanacetum coccineum TaxID=301880 RepID=A0ABQ4XF62_9ASTR
MEELRLRSRSSVLHTGTTSSAPQVLLAEASSRNQTGWNNHEWDNRTTTREVLLANCNNFNNYAPLRGLYLCMLDSNLGGLCGFECMYSQRTAASTTLTSQQPGWPNCGFKGIIRPIWPTATPGSTPANGQATLLPQAFNTMTLRDPTDANWNMDTGASSHLNSNAKLLIF